MTQPEQEAREMLAVCPNPECGSDKIDVLAAVIEGDDAAAIQGYAECWDCGVRGPKTCGYSGAELSKCRSKAKAKAAEMWNAFARPTAGIDREVLGRLIDPDAWHETLPTDGCGTYWMSRRYNARQKADAILALFPTPAKTGERGAVIEECDAPARVR